MNENIRNSKSHIFVDSLEDQIVISEQDGHHLTKSLRLNVGDVISAASNSKVRTYELSGIDAGTVTAKALSDVSDVEEPTIEIFASLIKIDRLEFGIAKSVETGVSKIVLGNTRRSQIHLSKDKQKKLLTRFESIIKSAAMQSRRSNLPEISFTNNLIEDFLSSQNTKVVCEPSGDKELVSSPVSFLIGPEGGFDPDEENMFSGGVTKLNISPNILRAETAFCIAPSRVKW